MRKWTKVIGSIMAVTLLATALAGVAIAQEAGDNGDEVGAGAGRRFGFVDREGANRRNLEACDGEPAYDGEGAGHRFGAGVNEDCDGEAIRARDGSGTGYGRGGNGDCHGDCDGTPARDGTGSGHRFGLGNQEGSAQRGGHGGR